MTTGKVLEYLNDQTEYPYSYADELQELLVEMHAAHAKTDEELTQALDEIEQFRKGDISMGEEQKLLNLIEELEIAACEIASEIAGCIDGDDVDPLVKALNVLNKSLNDAYRRAESIRTVHRSGEISLALDWLLEAIDTDPTVSNYHVLLDEKEKFSPILFNYILSLERSQE